MTSIQTLGSLGLGKKGPMDVIIREEAEHINKVFAKAAQEGTPLKMNRRFPPAINNVVWRMLNGKSTSQDDEELKHLTDSICEVFQGNDFRNVLRQIEGSSPFISACVKFVTLMEIVQRINNDFFRFLGYKTAGDFTKPLKTMVDREVTEKEADPNGFFIEK